jgi:hypothetical protein
MFWLYRNFPMFWLYSNFPMFWLYLYLYLYHTHRLCIENWYKTNDISKSYYSRLLQPRKTPPPYNVACHSHESPLSTHVTSCVFFSAACDPRWRLARRVHRAARIPNYPHHKKYSYFLLGLTLFQPKSGFAWTL